MKLMKTHFHNLSVVSPAKYKISVVGVLDESFSDRLCGLSISNQVLDQDQIKPVATLTGHLADQAALFGVLNALYNMHMPLLAVEYINSDEN